MERQASIREEKEEALRIVQDILGNTVEKDRIIPGTTKSYFPIYLDGDSRKTICRLYFTANRYIGTITDRNVETKIQIRTVSDINRFSRDMKIVVAKYLNK